MKRVLNIILILTIPLLVLSGCKRFEDPIFEESSSERVQQLMNKTFETLTSSENGWYFMVAPGWDDSYKRGGYWFWCKFDKTNRTVTASFEMDVIFNTNGESMSYPTGETYESPFEMISSRGAVISFNIKNPILDVFVEPSGSSATYMGAQGETDYQIASVTDDLVTVKGVKTGNTMFFVKKTDDKNPTEAFKVVSDFHDKYSASPAWSVEFSNALKGSDIAAPSVTLADRAFILKYTELDDEVTAEGDPIYNNITLRLPFYPNLAGDNTVTVIGQKKVLGTEITSFTFAYEGEIGVFTSNDANKSIRLLQVFPPVNELFSMKLWYHEPENTDPAMDLHPGEDFSASFMAAWQTAKASIFVDPNGPMDLQAIAMGHTADWLTGRPSPSIAFLTDVYIGQYEMRFIPVAGTENELEMEYVGFGLNGSPFQNTYLPLINLFVAKSPYVIESNSETAPSYLFFKSKADADFFFTVNFDS